MSDVREMLGDSLGRLFSDRVTPAVIAAAESGAWPTSLWAEIESLGVPSLLASEACGGVGGLWADAFVIGLAVGRHGVPVPLMETVIATWLLAEGGIESPGGPLTIASLGDLSLDSGTATGELREIAWARSTSHVVAISGGARPEIVLLRCDAGVMTPGLNIALEPRDGLRFESASIAGRAPLPGHIAPDALLLAGGLARSAQIAGALDQALNMTTQYAGDRAQFGRPIAQFQAVQQQVAVLATHAAAARVAADAGFASADSGLRLGAVATAKICASEAASVGASIAHAVHGAIGFTHEHSLHFFTRRLWSWRSEFGSQRYWSERLGRAACAAGGEAMWPSLTEDTLK